MAHRLFPTRVILDTEDVTSTFVVNLHGPIARRDDLAIRLRALEDGIDLQSIVGALKEWTCADRGTCGYSLYHVAGRYVVEVYLTNLSPSTRTNAQSVVEGLRPQFAGRDVAVLPRHAINGVPAELEDRSDSIRYLAPGYESNRAA